MAVIRLELEVDSEVYPELHAALVAVSSSASRGERFRQLAATGLVWETVRVHGASVTRIQAVPVAAPAAALASAPVPAPAPAPAFAGGDRIGKNGAGRATEKPPAERRAPKSNGDFIDLALNAAPAEMDAVDPVDAHTQNDPLHIPLRQIPMLMDVVNPPPELRETVVPVTTRVEAPAPVTAEPREATPAQPLTTATFEDDITDPPDSPSEGANAPASEEDLAPKTPVRSRLLRMKEMGLFKNG